MIHYWLLLPCRRAEQYICLVQEYDGDGGRPITQVNDRENVEMKKQKRDSGSGKCPEGFKKEMSPSDLVGARAREDDHTSTVLWSGQTALRRIMLGTV